MNASLILRLSIYFDLDETYCATRPITTVLRASTDKGNWNIILTPFFNSIATLFMKIKKKASLKLLS